MTTEANELLALALKKIDLRDGFIPADLGSKIGLTKLQSDAAARDLANNGVLVIGFDLSAEFSDDFRKMRSPAPTKIAKSVKKKSVKPKRVAVQV